MFNVLKTEKGKMKMPNKNQWFKLDNAAKIYPPARTRNRTTMFRLSATLKDKVDTNILKTALEITLKRFPSFSCRLKSGFFWYYLEHIDGTPPILPDVKNPMAHLNMKKNRDFMFRVRCYHGRIALEFFHVLTDASGAMSFLLTLVKEYIRLYYGADAPCSGYILDTNDSPQPCEYEDSFLKYAKKERLTRSEEAAYHPTFTALPLHQLLLTSGTIPTDVLVKKAKEYNVTVTVFLTALLIEAIANLQKTESSAAKRKLPVKVSVPVNLRRFFSSKTLRNFSSYLNPGIDTRLGDFSFEEILVQVKSLLDSRATDKYLNARFSENVAMERNIFVRLVPLFIKKPILRFFFNHQGDSYISSTLSNLGVVELPDELIEYVKRLDFLLGQPFTLLPVCACLSYNGSTILNFSRTYAEPHVEREFFTLLVKHGIPVYIESNGRC